MKGCNMINSEVRDINCRNVKEDNFSGAHILGFELVIQSRLTFR